MRLVGIDRHRPLPSHRPEKIAQTNDALGVLRLA
jgi:hypothetical protein